MRRLLYTLLLILTFLASCSPRNRGSVPEPSLTLEDCGLTSPVGDQVDARCGSFSVPEDRANPAGRQIELQVAVIPAIKRNPEPDPLFMLAGGPGQAAIEAFPAIVRLMFSIHQERDIVLVDQRGTGQSNPLRCLDPEDETLTDEEALAKLKACPEKVEADLRFYTTEIAMTDLDEIRSALGYETINIYGASYGTRAALTYLRMFPERVRTLTLDAVVDPEFVLFMDAAEDGQAALDDFFARCEADADCASAFPDLKAEFSAIVERLDQSPAKISIPHPLTHKPLELTLTREMLSNLVFNTLYVPELVATLPLSIHVAFVDENYVPLISQAFLVNAGLYDGMFYSVACTEDAPLIDAESAARSSEATVFGNHASDLMEVCAAWPKGQVSSDFRQPISSTVPVLMLSGEADPITPPWHAEKVAKSFTNEIHLVFPDMGHGNLSSHCTINLFKDFLVSASTLGLDTACVEALQPPPFFVDFSGPRP